MRKTTREEKIVRPGVYMTDDDDDTQGYLASQPKREWVGLTDEEFQWIYDHGRTPAGMMEMVEAKLRSKNHD